MAVFGCIHTDKCVQVGDKFPIDVARSWSTPGSSPFKMVEIRPTALDSYYEVTSSDEYKLCWQYETQGEEEITLKITLDDDTEYEFTQSITVKSEEEDCVFADDNCLTVFEPDILKDLPCDRCSYIFIHRKVAQCIIDCLRKILISNNSCDPIDPKDLKGSEEIEKWATYWALEIIFEGISNSVDDVFSSKAKLYHEMRMRAQNSGSIWFDSNGDGLVGNGEIISSWFREIIRR